MTIEAGAARRCTVRGATLTWTGQGEGPAVIWAHGLLSGMFTLERTGIFDWTPVARSGRRLVRYDARGHGQSSAGADPQDYTWASLAADLLGLADTIQPDAPVSAIGCSMGTASILHAALRAPQRFDRVVLTAPPTAWETRRAQASVYQQAAALIAERGPQAVLELLARLPRPPIFQGLADQPFDVEASVVGPLLQGAGRSDLPALEALQKLDLPVLILAWEGDPAHPTTTAERLAEAIPGAELQVTDRLETVRRWGQVAAEFLAQP